jgi:putative addiction module killer protein
MEIIRYLTPEGVDVFEQWFRSIRDNVAKTSIRRRLDRLASGNPGSHRYLRDGVAELRIDHGPGYRVYYAQSGGMIILLLCGGDKGSQEKDIDRAIAYWEQWKARNRR